jgi:hypothetical protein
MRHPRQNLLASTPYITQKIGTARWKTKKYDPANLIFAGSKNKTGAGFLDLRNLDTDRVITEFIPGLFEGAFSCLGV